MKAATSILVLALLGALTLEAQQYTISTVAGGAPPPRR